ncbi:MAG: hypothetical protein RSB28_06480 [Oscillospiraceae bacterium]
MKIISIIKTTTLKKPSKIYWLFLAVVFALLLPNFFYNDLIITTRQSINLWHCIADDSVLNFFAYNSNPDNLHTYSHIPVQGCAYSFVVYLVFAIWNLPLFFLERFGNVDIFANPAIVFYSKLILVIFLFLSANIFKKICFQLDLDETRSAWASYLFVSSALVYSCVIIIGQYDIFSLFFTLLGVSAFLKDDKLGFIGWFSVAFMFKFFSFIIFVQLLLLKQKKILKILKCIIYSFIPYLILKLVFALGTTYTGKTDTGGLGSMFFSSWFGHSDLSFGNMSLSLFLLAITLICILAYYLNPENDKLSAKYAIYLSALAYCSFFVFIPAYPYWYILMSPFIILLLFFNKSNFKLNLLLETIGMACLFLSQQISGAYWCFSNRLFIPTFWNLFFDVNREGFTPRYTHELINSAGNRIGFDNLSLLLTLLTGSIFVATMISILVINRPKKSIDNSEGEIQFIVDIGIVRFRNIMNIFLAIIPIIVFLFNVLHY